MRLALRKLSASSPAPARRTNSTLTTTIKSTAEHGYLDVKLQPRAAQRREGAALS
jgi:uncharacterized protein with von Willebrand factor type A (vWA) domain